MRAFIILTLPIVFAAAEDASPVARVIGLLNDMAGKIKEESKAEDAKFKKHSALCDKRISELKYEIKTAKSVIEETTAKIEKASGKLEAIASTLEETQATIASSEADLQAATEVRKSESQDFKAAEQDLLDTHDTIERALKVLDEDESKGGASLLQVAGTGAQKAVQVVKAMLEASMIRSEDAKTLTSLLQDEDTDFQPPTPEAYKKKNGAVLDMLEDLMGKSQEELRDLRKKETAAKQSFELVVQGLQDEIKFAKQNLEKNKKMQAEEQKIKADNEKDLMQTQTSLATDEKTFSDFSADCKQEAADYNEEAKSRVMETEAVDKAIAALKESSPGAAATSFIQLAQNVAHRSSIRNARDLKHFEVVRLVRGLGQKVNDQQLVLLSRRMDAMLRSEAASGENVFDKISKLINDMIDNMKKNLQEAATKKDYCDSENAKNKGKQDEKQGELDDISTKIDQATSKSTMLKKEVADLKKELATLATTEAEMTELRQEEKALFAKNEPETVASIDGVKLALKILRDFYKNSGTKVTSGEREGAAGGIIGRLEDCEADFAMSLAQMRSSEKTAAKDFEKDMQELKLQKVQKEKDEQYKTAESKRLDADAEGLATDKESLSTEMGAIMDYQKGLDAECIVSEASFAEKQAEKEKEITGLEEALAALDATSDTATPAAASLVQRSVRLRGHHQHLEAR